MPSSPSLETDPLVQIRLSDLLALRAAAANTPAPAPSAPPPLALELPSIVAEYLDTKAAAKLLGVSVKGLEAMRARGEGPKCTRRRVRYHRDDLRRAG